MSISNVRRFWAVGRAVNRRIVLLIVTTPPARTHSPCRHCIVRQGARREITPSRVNGILLKKLSFFIWRAPLSQDRVATSWRLCVAPHLSSSRFPATGQRETAQRRQTRRRRG